VNCASRHVSMLSSQQVDSQQAFLNRHKYGCVRLHPAQETTKSESLAAHRNTLSPGTGSAGHNPLQGTAKSRPRTILCGTVLSYHLFAPRRSINLHPELPPFGPGPRERTSHRGTAAKTRSPAICRFGAETSIWHVLYNLGPPALSSLKIRLFTRKCPLLAPAHRDVATKSLLPRGLRPFPPSASIILSCPGRPLHCARRDSDP
jgi:hypothetical protein